MLSLGNEMKYDVINAPYRVQLPGNRKNFISLLNETSFKTSSSLIPRFLKAGEIFSDI